MQLDLGEVWNYRELIWVLVRRNILAQYKQTVMGVAWAIIRPITTMVIFSIIFGGLAKIPSDGYPYPVFVFSGMLAWSFFSSSVSAGGASLVGASGMISKVYFPRLILPLTSIGTSGVEFVISTIILLCLMLGFGVPLTWKILLAPFFIFGLIVVSFGTGSWLAAVTVSYRDFRYVTGFMLQIWMYVTPVIYPISFIPEDWRWLLYLNPVYAWISGVRACFLNQPIDQFGVVVSGLVSLVILVIGLLYFGKTERRFADVI